MSNQFSRTLLSVHCYSGDANQVRLLMDLYEHHKIPIVVISPVDAPMLKAGKHICRQAGLREYYGQKSWDRQVAQMKVLLEYPEFTYYLMHDSDSICLDPILPDYLFENDNVIYSNLVDDFRRPGESWNGLPPWPDTYHAGFVLKASQPPYFCSRKVLEKLVAVPRQEICPITPFIDWQMIVLPTLAGVEMLPFRNCASCETETSHGRAVMSECVTKRGATFIHAIKTKKAKDMVTMLHRRRKNNYEKNK